MKKTSIISILIACVGLGTMTTSCEDMLSPESERHSYEVAQDTLYSYWGILKSWQNVAERYTVLGECRGELIAGTSHLSDSIEAILNFRMDEAVDGSCRFLKASDYYHIINSCNAYLSQCDTLRQTGTLQPYMKKEAAQVEAIRAWTYLQLVLNYREVPFYLDPKLTSDDLTEFMKSPTMATSDNIADLLAENLTRAQRWEMMYGFPEYNNYVTCNATKAMIPLNLILGDLYLTQGDQRSCELAAGYYYDYLSNNQGMGHITPGGMLPLHYDASGYMSENMEKPYYSITSGYYPWAETGAPSSTTESITAIPSATSKLDGTVLRGVDELYGYTSEISVNTDTTGTTSSSIFLEAKYDAKQLTASQAYFNLCKEQKYEVYVDAGDGVPPTVTVDPEIGDARQVWVQDLRVYYSNGLSDTEKFITKLNPIGYASRYPSFSTVSHTIYRKSMVWLRYAEALCGAGYPSYAFAILKNGLCQNDDWYPKADSEEYMHAATRTYFRVCTDGTILPEDYLDGTYQSEEEFNVYIGQVISDLQTEVDALQAEYDALPTGAEKTAKRRELNAKKAELTNVTGGRDESKGFTFVNMNYTDEETCTKVLSYLDQREVRRSPRFLNFDINEFEGNIASQSVSKKISLRGTGIAGTFEADIRSQKVTKGVHSRGCGHLLYDERYSTYDYVELVKERSKAYNNGTALEKEDIYSGNYDEIVRKCVEDIIVDEEALELAFEGTRFFDLWRVAHRRMQQGDPKAEEWFAEKLEKRDSSLKGKLMNYKNWFFPLPAR